MKNRFIFILFFVTYIGYSQSHGISYQAVLLNPKGEELPGQNNSYSPLLDKNVCLRFEIRNATNQLEYQETINTKTDSFGMVNVIIGTGNRIGGTAANFNAVGWNTVPKKLVVALNIEGNCNSFIEISNQNFTGVPFAFSAQNAENVTGIVPITNGGTSATTAPDARINLGLGNVDNTSDANKPISIANQTALDAKENLFNKSTNIIADGNSTVKYPSVKIIKDYVDSSISAGVPDATTTTKGKIQLAGDLTGTASAPLIANNAITDAKIANGISAFKVGLGNVDNTSDLNKPIATATQTALNLKQNALINPVTGTGTTNFLSKFNGTGTIGVSQIFDDGTNLGIGTTSPLSRLSITSSTSSNTLSLESSSTDGTILTMMNNSSGGGYWRVYSSGSANSEGAGNLLFNNLNGVPMMIRSSGNVLIGTTIDNGAKLQVNGTGRFSGQLSLGSTITNGTNTFTLPSVSGRLALTSQIDNKQNTLSGSGLVKSTSGTISYLTDNSSNWDEAYRDKISMAEVTGTTTKTLTLTQQDGGTVSASWSSLAIGIPNGLFITGDRISLGVSTANNTGALTSADWNRFNNKQNVLTNPVTGTGTVNNLPKFTGSSTLGDSNISDNGTIVAIATNATINGNLLLGSTNDSGAKLQVTGAVTVDGTIANKTSNDEGTDTTIDFSLSNIAYTSATSDVITVTNIKDGGIYYLAITTTSVNDQLDFTSTGFTIKYLGDRTRIIGKAHMYRFVVAGTMVFVSIEKEN